MERFNNSIETEHQSVVFNTLHAFRDGKARNFCTAVECTLVNHLNARRYRIGTLVIFRHQHKQTVIIDRILQRIQYIERPRTDRLNRISKVYAL